MGVGLVHVSWRRPGEGSCYVVVIWMARTERMIRLTVATIWWLLFWYTWAVVVFEETPRTRFYSNCSENIHKSFLDVIIIKETMTGLFRFLMNRQLGSNQIWVNLRPNTAREPICRICRLKPDLRWRFRKLLRMPKLSNLARCKFDFHQHGCYTWYDLITEVPVKLPYTKLRYYRAAHFINLK